MPSYAVCTPLGLHSGLPLHETLSSRARCLVFQPSRCSPFRWHLESGCETQQVSFKMHRWRIDPHIREIGYIIVSSRSMPQLAPACSFNRGCLGFTSSDVSTHFDRWNVFSFYRKQAHQTRLFRRCSGGNGCNSSVRDSGIDGLQTTSSN